MPSNSLDRFKKRQKLKNSISVYANEIGNDEVNEFLFMLMRLGMMK